MMDVLPIVLGVVAVVFGVIALVLWRRSAAIAAEAERWRGQSEETARALGMAEARAEALSQERERMIAAGHARDEALAAAEHERRELASKIAAESAARAAERTAMEEKLELLEANRAALTTQFKSLAGEVLREHGEDFRKTADAQLKTLVDPLKENIGRFEGEMRSAHEAALKERAALKEQLGTLSLRSEAMSKQAADLTRALKGDVRKQGAWGEAILETVLEGSGLEQGREYRTQSFTRDEEGRGLRPDVVVTLPGDRELVIDSKVSLLDYERAVNAEDDPARDASLSRHVLSMQRHIKQLAEKNYSAVTAGSLDYVIMFVPIEAALAEAVKQDDGLTGYALSRQVMIATPTTLMMALRTVKAVWDVERRNRNAQAIADRAGLIYNKLVGFTEDMEKVGKQLASARDSHAAAVSKLSAGNGNVLGQIQKLKQLGAKTDKSFPASLNVDDEAAAETAPPPLSAVVNGPSRS